MAVKRQAIAYRSANNEGLGVRVLLVSPEGVETIYLQRVLDQMEGFKKCVMFHITRSKNNKAYALSKLLSVRFNHLGKKNQLQTIAKHTIHIVELYEIIIPGWTWMTPLINSFNRGELSDNKVEMKALKYELKDGLFIKRFVLIS